MNLLDHIRDLGQAATLLRRQQILVLGGTTLVGLWGLLAAGDAVVQPRDAGLRWILFFLALLAAGMVGSWGVRAWRQLGADPLLLARLIEKKYPKYRDRLTSAVEFLLADETAEQGSSPALRRHVVLNTAAELQDFQWKSLLDYRPLRRAMAGCCALFTLLGLISWRWPTETRLATERLLAPWSALDWPRAHRLALRQPVNQVVRGSAFEVDIYNQEGDLPDDLQIVYRWRTPRGQMRSETQSIPWRPGSALVRREQVLVPFEFRVFGGDDDTMPWQSVRVIDPARVTDFTIIVHPPAYTGWPAYPSGPQVVALAGSALTIQGRADQPLLSAVVVTGDARIPLRLGSSKLDFFGPELPPATQQIPGSPITPVPGPSSPPEGEKSAPPVPPAEDAPATEDAPDTIMAGQLPATTLENIADSRGMRIQPASRTILGMNSNPWSGGYAPGLRFVSRQGPALPPTKLPEARHWLLTANADYQVTLTDSHRLTSQGTNLWKARAVVDQPPVIEWTAPQTGMLVIPQARLKLRGTLRDDLRLAGWGIYFQRSLSAGAATEWREFFAGPAVPAPPTTDELALIARGEFPAELRPLEEEWDLTPLRLHPGYQFEFSLAARDYANQETRSTPRILNVVTPQQYAQRLAQRLTGLLAELSRVRQLQEQVHRQSQDIASAWQGTALANDAPQPATTPITPAQIAGLAAASQLQTQITRSLVGESEGVAAQLRSLLEELYINRQESEPSARQAESLLAAITLLHERDLPTVERELALVAKSAGELAPAGGQPNPPPTVSSSPQLLDSLLACAQGQQRIIATLEDLLLNWTEATSLAMVKAELQQILAEQQELSTLVQAQTAAALGKLWEELLPDQRAALADLQQRQSGLAARLEKLLPRLRLLETKEDRQSQQAVQYALRLWSRQNPSVLLQTAATAIGENRLGPAASRQLTATQVLTQLIEALQLRYRDPPAGQANQAGNSAAAAAAAAQQEIQELLRLVTDILQRQTEAQLGSEQLLVRANAGTWNSATQDALAQLANRQNSLAQETLVLALSLKAQPVLHYSLTGAHGAMQGASRELGQSTTLTAAVSLQSEAIAKLKILQQGLTAAAKSPPAAPPSNAASAPPGADPLPPAQQLLQALRLKELQVLRLLQADLNRRTMELEVNRVPGENLTPAQQTLYAKLAAEQSRLRELLRKMLAELGQPEPENPE
ncbi:MAG: hypothetical protein SFX18_11550 [Pirellulales bacterium]|nr:hypothetical protein [Pirellulales bacterium]